jgi:hypothetical protein
MNMGRALRFAAALLFLGLLASCVIPGMGLDGTGDVKLLPVPRRVTYNVFSDPFYPRTDIVVYKCKRDGTMVQVPVETLDRVGIITEPSDDPDGADDVNKWLEPLTGSYTFQRAGRHDVVLSYNDSTAMGRYSVWVEDPLGLTPDTPGSGGEGGGIGIEWGN